MQILYTTLLAMTAGSTLLLQPMLAQDYPTNYTGQTASRSGSRLFKLTLSGEGMTTQEIEVTSTEGYQLHQQLTEPVITVKPGQSIQITPDYERSWMHAYVYLDEGQDGQFSFDVDTENKKALAGSDLKSFSFYSFAPDSEDPGYDSEGNSYTGDARGNALTPPAFTAPTTPGDYHVRFKIDWNNINPAGDTTSDGSGEGDGMGQGNLKENGGIIVDFILHVAADTPVDPTESLTAPYTADFSTNPEGWTTLDNSTTPGKTWKYVEGNFGYYESGRYIPCITMDDDYNALYDDYYISPAIKLAPGTYTVKANVAKNNGNAAVSLLMGTDAADISSFETISELTTPENYSTDNAQSFDVTIETEGTYHFAFHGTTANQYAPERIYIFSFSVADKNGGGTVDPDTPEPVSMPYSVDLQQPQADWKIQDYNGDNSTFQFYQNMGYAAESSSNDVNDALFSPYFQLKAGQKYRVTTVIEGAFTDPNATLSLEKGTSANSMTTITAKMDIPELGEKTQIHEFTATADEIAMFSLHLKQNANAGSYQAIYLSGFAIEEIDGGGSTDIVIGEPVFTADFSGDDPAAGWTIIDANADDETWTARTTDPVGISYTSESATTSDDLLISPSVELKADQDYFIDYTMVQAAAFDADRIELVCGTAPTAEAMTTVIGQDDIYMNNGAGRFSGVHRLTATADGTFYFGLRAKTPGNGTLTLTALKVTPVLKAFPTAVSDLTAAHDKESDLVTLEWTNPTVDTEGIAIGSGLKANIYENGTLIATVEDQKPGKKGSYSFAPAEGLSGKVTYKVEAMIGENKSKIASVTINLDDAAGEPILITAFPISRDEFTNNWVTEDNGGTSQWAFNYGEVISFKYKLGQTNDNDWLFSSLFDLSTDTRYCVGYELQGSENYSSNVELTIGTAQQSSAHKQVIDSKPGFLQNGFGQFMTEQFSIGEDGKYCIGFHVTKANYDLSLRKVCLYYIGDKPVGIEETARRVDMIGFNRTAGQLSVPVEGSLVSIFDLSGRLVGRQTADSNGIVSLKQLPKGVYTIHTSGTDGKALTIKITK